MITANFPPYGISEERGRKLHDPHSFESMAKRDELNSLSWKLLIDSVEQLRLRVVDLETEILELKRDKL